MSIDHTKTRVTLTIDGKPVEFGKLVPKDILDAIQWANDRERDRALTMIHADNIADRIAVFNATGSRWKLHNLGEALQEADILVECLRRCHLKANPDTTPDEFYELWGNLDLGMLESYFNAVSGLDDSADDPNGEGQETATMTDGSAGKL